MKSTSHQQTPGSVADLRTAVKSAFETPDWYFNRLNYRIQLRKQIVEEWTRMLSFNHYLDIGCGDGSISLPLLRSGRRLTLQDLSDAMLARARSTVPPGFQESVETVAGDFLQMDIAPNLYDLVISLGVVSYIKDLEVFIKKLASLVAPGGRVIIECTDASHLATKISAAYSCTTALLRKPAINLGLQSHTAAQISQAFDKLGFVLVGTYRYSVPPPLVRRFFNQNFHHRVNRLLHGPASGNRLAWFGSECIFHYQRPGLPVTDLG
jgi:2-polyprenyl-3-methyl-5-hydroxy-6-metoxy-1,4-benzoquinol methylase